jgi:hypothetical protein
MFVFDGWDADSGGRHFLYIMAPPRPARRKGGVHTHITALPVARVGIREILPADVGGGKGSWLNKHTEHVRGAALHQTPRCRYLTEPAKIHIKGLKRGVLGSGRCPKPRCNLMSGSA